MGYLRNFSLNLYRLKVWRQYPSLPCEHGQTRVSQNWRLVDPINSRFSFCSVIGRGHAADTGRSARYCNDGCGVYAGLTAIGWERSYICELWSSVFMTSDGES